MNKLQQLYSSPNPFSAYEQRQRRETLNKIIWAIFFISIPLACINFLFGSRSSALVIFCVPPACLVTFFLNKKGHYHAAGALISYLVFFAIVFDLYYAGGLTSDLGAVAFPVFIAICSLLFGKRGIYIFSTLTILSVITIGSFELNGFIKEQGTTDIYDVATLVTLVTGMSVILWVIIDNHNKNMDRIKNDDLSLRISFEVTLEGLAKALEYRDRETKNHSSRVVEMSFRLARAASLSDEDLLNIKRGALLHDIGKLAIPDSILQKPGKLTDEEWVIMKTHPAKAVEILEPIPFLKSAIQIPYCHHENWDGTGYPRGLKGEQIPLYARLFAIIDQWEALTDDRVYRKAWPYENVIQYIKDNSGRIYDPKIAALFLDLVKNDPEGFGSIHLDGEIPVDII